MKSDQIPSNKKQAVGADFFNNNTKKLLFIKFEYIDN